jgi:hypothetical protein
MNKDQSMTAWEIFYQGRYFAKRSKKLWFLLWLLNALFAMVAALPVFSVLGNELNHSLMGAAVFDRFNLDFASEVLFKYVDSAPFLLMVIVAVGGVYLVLTLLATGGTIRVFATPERSFKAAVFFKGCGDYFWRFLRLFIIAGIFYGIFVVALNGALEAGISRLVKSWTEARFFILLTWARLLLVVFVFLVVNMIFDYAKVRLVVDAGRSAIMAAFRSVKFVFKNFKKAFSLFLFCVLLGAIFIAIYNPLEHVLPQYTKRWVVVVFFLQQLFILARVYVRLTFFSSEVILYESLKPAPISAERNANAASRTTAPIVNPQIGSTPDRAAAVDPAI